MGGGAGTRLFPLTKDRAKPAVPLAGKYRLVDIPISNCLNSGSAGSSSSRSSTAGRCTATSRRATGSTTSRRGFVEILAAEQTPEQHGLVPGHRRRRAPEPGPHGVRTATASCSSSPATSSTGWTTAHDPRAARRERRRRDGGDDPGARGRRRRLRHHGGRTTSGRITRFVEKPTDPAEQATLRGYPNELPGLDGHLRLRPRGAGRRARRQRGRTSASTSSRG